MNLADLHRVALVEVYSVHDQPDGPAELRGVAHDRQHVQRVYQGQAEVPQHVVNVDVVRILQVWTPACKT